MTFRRPPAPITVYGRTTCEDTALVRDRLARLGIPFTDVDLDLDAEGARLVASLNNGNEITPTLVFGGPDMAMAEPSLDDLDAQLLEEGWRIRRPEPALFTRAIMAGPLPLPTLAEPSGSTFQLAEFRGRRQLAIFFAHAGDCRTCGGYARQLASTGPALQNANARALVVVPGGPADAERWVAEVSSSVPIVADAGSRWKKAVGARVELDVGGSDAVLMAVDGAFAPRFGSSAPDAGGLITPSQAAEWLEFASADSAGRDAQ